MNLTQQNYHSRKANLEYMSVSQFKSFEVCPHRAIAEIKGKYKREETTSLLVGSYVDAYFSEELPEFKTAHPEIFKKDGTLKADYIQAEQIIERIKRDRKMMRYLSGSHQVIMTGVIQGVPVKIKIDSLLTNCIVDQKIVKDFESIYDPEKGRVPWFEFWEYDLQGAVYQEVVRQNTGRTLPFVIAGATKEKITDIDLININQNSLDLAFDRFLRDVESYDAMKKGIIPGERCDKCDYCKETKKLTGLTDSDEYYLF